MTFRETLPEALVEELAVRAPSDLDWGQSVDRWAYITGCFMTKNDKNATSVNATHQDAACDSPMNPANEFFGWATWREIAFSSRSRRCIKTPQRNANQEKVGDYVGASHDLQVLLFRCAKTSENFQLRRRTCLTMPLLPCLDVTRHLYEWLVLEMH